MELARVRNAAAFEGEWHDGRPYRGFGHFVSKDGKTSFDGFFRKGAPFQGSGTWVDSRARKYAGHVQDAWPVNGEGSIACLGNVYEGVWENGEGQGTIVPQSDAPGDGTKEGWEFRGEFGAADARVDPEQRPIRGSGVFVSHEGLRCTGMWSGGEVVRGEGSWRSGSTGFLFAGEFVEVGRGKGTIVTLSSHKRELKFVGEWRDSLPYTGKGEIAVDGTTFRGEWKEGNRFYRGKKYELADDVAAALKRHLDRQTAAKTESLCALRSKSLKALPSMGAVQDKSPLDRAEDKRAAQRAARRDRRKEKGRAQKLVSPSAVNGRNEVGSPVAAKALPTLAVSTNALSRKAAVVKVDDLYKISKPEPVEDDAHRRRMVSKLVSNSVRRHEVKLAKNKQEKQLTPLEKALQAAEESVQTRRPNADDKGKRKSRRPKNRSGTDGGRRDGSAAGASGAVAIEGWIKNAAAAATGVTAQDNDIN